MSILDRGGQPIEQGGPSAKPIQRFLRKLWVVLRKQWPMALSNIIAVVALCAAFISVYLSRESNRTAADALETSRHQFLQSNKPYIALSPAKFDSGLYRKFVQEGKAIRLSLKYKFTNIGNVAARDISLQDVIALANETGLGVGARTEYGSSCPMALGPGEHLYTTPRLIIEFDTEEAARRSLERLSSMEGGSMTSLLSVEYRSELDEARVYRSLMENRIRNDKAQIIRSEVIGISAEEEMRNEVR